MRLERLTPAVERTADELLDVMADAGHGELQSRFTRPLPALVIADLLGVPRADRAEFQTWSDQLAHVVFAAEVGGGAVHDVISAATRFTEYFDALIEERRRRPGDDVISALLATSAGGGPPADELVGACTLLLFAGHETTAGLLANATCLLFEHDDARAALLADPSLWPTAVDECMRFAGPAKVMVRKSTVAREWLGASVDVGDTVFLGILAADRDPAVFARPDVFDIRRDPNPHFGFGWGLHHCLGASLARLETRIAFRRMFERFPRLRPAADGPVWGGGVLGRSAVAVPVEI
jgi:cytochrome P450